MSTIKIKWTKRIMNARIKEEIILDLLDVKEKFIKGMKE